MKRSTKILLGMLVASAVVASVVTGAPQPIVFVGMLFIVGWLVLRVFVFLSLLLKPVRDKFQPQTDAINKHVDESLRRSGLGVIADVGEKMQNGFDEAVKQTQEGIDKRQSKK